MSKKNQPTREALEAAAKARIEENRQLLRTSRDIAAKIFGGTPTPEQTIFVSQATESGVPKDLLPGFVENAKTFAAKHNAHDDTTVISLVDILLDDDDAEEHLADAIKEAERLYGTNLKAETWLDVYYQIYGEDEEEGEED